MNRRRGWRARLAGLAGVGAVLSASGAWSETAPATTLSREQVNPAQQVLPSRRQRPTDVFSGPIKEACTLSADSSLAFTFTKGIIDDPAKVLSDHERADAWAGLAGRSITPHDLCEIRDRLAVRIFQRGVLARVVIPPQTITGGVVKFQIIAARIVSVRFDGDDIGAAQTQVEAYLNHMRERSAFKLDDAQRWLLLVNDIPGVQAVAKIAHSDAPGAPPEGLDMIVTLRRAPIDESAMVANTNAKTLGPWNGLARVDFNSFTPFGERTSLVAYTTLGNFRQDVFQVLEAARLGDSGLFAQASFSYGHSQPGNVLAPLGITGDSYVGTFEVDYPIIRLQRENLLVAGGIDLINQHTVSAESPTQPLADDGLRVLWLRTDASVAATDRPWGSNIVTMGADLSIQGRKGLDALGASRLGDLGLSRPGGHADAWVMRAEGHTFFRVAPADAAWLPITISTHFVSQIADRALLAYEQQAIGNLTVGRGYDPSAAAGDEVVAGEVKVEVGPVTVGKRVKVTPYIFDDTAQVSYLGGGTQNLTLRSIGGGLEFRIPYDARGDAVRMDLGYAKPLDRTSVVASRKPPERFLIQIIINH